MIFIFVLVFCAGLCAGVSGLTIYLNYMNSEDRYELSREEKESGRERFESEGF